MNFRTLPLLLLLALPVVVEAQFSYKTNDGGITITGYAGLGGDVTIPSAINGLPVTSIGSYAFWGLGGEITITIPDSVSSIGSYAFASNPTLTTAKIPASVTNIGNLAFLDCQSLKVITVDSGNSAYTSMDGVVFDKNQTTLLIYPAGKAHSYIIPSSVTTIGEGAFMNCFYVASIAIPTNVKNIGSFAFSSCTSLTEVAIPPSVIQIGENAFYNCQKMTTIAIPGSIKNIPKSAFQSCFTLAVVTIGEGVTNIGDYAFIDAVMTNIAIPASVTHIGDQAFSSCNRLLGVHFEGDAPAYGSHVFADSGPATVYYLPGTTGWTSVFAGLPANPWFLPNPLILMTGPSFGVQTNGFGFVISWATNAAVAVEASMNLGDPSWVPVGTNTLINGSSYFTDTEWANYPSRFYRLRWP